MITNKILIFWAFYRILIRVLGHFDIVLLRSSLKLDAIHSEISFEVWVLSDKKIHTLHSSLHKEPKI